MVCIRYCSPFFLFRLSSSFLIACLYSFLVSFLFLSKGRCTSIRRPASFHSLYATPFLFNAKAISSFHIFNISLFLQYCRCLECFLVDVTNRSIVFVGHFVCLTYLWNMSLHFIIFSLISSLHRSLSTFSHYILVVLLCCLASMIFSSLNIIGWWSHTLVTTSVIRSVL